MTENNPPSCKIVLCDKLINILVIHIVMTVFSMLRITNIRALLAYAIANINY